MNSYLDYISVGARLGELVDARPNGNLKFIGGQLHYEWTVKTSKGIRTEWRIVPSEDFEEVKAG